MKNSDMPASNLTKREHFAGLAMAALIPVYWETVDSYSSAEKLMECLMVNSIEHADALLAELDKE